jgi:hypothetical protein
MSDGSPKLIAIDEETDYQIVHSRRFRKANRAAHEPLDPGPQSDMFALDYLGVLFADCVLLGGDMPLVGAPPIGVKTCDAKWLQQALQFYRSSEKVPCAIMLPERRANHNSVSSRS